MRASDELIAERVKLAADRTAAGEREGEVHGRTTVRRWSACDAKRAVPSSPSCNRPSMALAAATSVCAVVVLLGLTRGAFASAAARPNRSSRARPGA